MHKAQQQVYEFNEAVGNNCPDEPEFDWQYLSRKPLNLILEETLEVAQAVRDQDPTNLIKEMCDLLYVVYGLAVEAGVNLEPFFTEVHKSNMRKLTGPMRADGKRLKPEGWTPPALQELFDATYGDTAK